MRYIYFFLAILTLSLSSCRDDFKFETSTGGLEFSKDTVYLDTVFTNIGSSTYTLKVYNKSNKDISIPKIALHKGDDSKFRMMVDGMTGDAGHTGKQFSNVELMANDSLFIFIEVTADVANANPNDFLYTDKIDFIHGNGEVQNVDLVTLIQDAIFIYPNRTQNGTTFTYEIAQIDLDSNGTFDDVYGRNLSGSLLHWTNQKPYVVYGFALVPNNNVLDIQAGTRVYFHANSGLIIDKNASISINGINPPNNNEIDLQNEVVFEGDRLEPNYDNISGQWFGIISYSTNNNNNINHLTLKNASVGIYLNRFNNQALAETPKLNINNSKILNCSNFGLLTKCAQVNSDNLVLNNAGQACLATTYGGIYNFNHGTFNNTWYSSNHTSVLINNYYKDDEGINIIGNTNYLTYNFTDCIVYGSSQNELFIEKQSITGQNVPNLNYMFKNCIIKTNVTNDINQFYPPVNTTNYVNCYIANTNNTNNPKFKNVAKHQLWPTENIYPALNTTTDILGKLGNNQVGAYKTITN